jgi:hypothetical protein
MIPNRKGGRKLAILADTPEGELLKYKSAVVKKEEENKKLKERNASQRRAIGNQSPKPRLYTKQS